MRREVLRIAGGDGIELFCIKFKRHWYDLKWKYVSVDWKETDTLDDAKLSTSIEQATKVFGKFFQNARK